MQFPQAFRALKILFYLFTLLISVTPLSNADELPQLLEKIGNSTLSSPSERTWYAAKLLLDRPYVLESSGEGARSYIDSDPVYNLDTFDCTTFLETTFALGRVPNPSAQSSDLFLKTLYQIRYSFWTGPTDFYPFPFRNHYPEVHWLTNLSRLGFIKKLETNPSLEQTIERVIDIPQFFKNKKMSLYQPKNQPALDTLGGDSAQWRHIREELQTRRPTDETSVKQTMIFLPWSSIDSERKLNNVFRVHRNKIYIFNLIKGDYFNPNVHDVMPIIGHQGLLKCTVKSKQQMNCVIRHASSAKDVNKTIEQPFLEWMRERITATSNAKWPNLGIAFYEILD